MCSESGEVRVRRIPSHNPTALRVTVTAQATIFDGRSELAVIASLQPALNVRAVIQYRVSRQCLEFQTSTFGAPLVLLQRYVAGINERNIGLARRQPWGVGTVLAEVWGSTTQDPPSASPVGSCPSGFHVRRSILLEAPSALGQDSCVLCAVTLETLVSLQPMGCQP